MEDSINENNISEGIVLGDRGREYLLTTAKWARFLSIVGFVMIGLFIVVAVIIWLFVIGVESAPDDVYFGAMEGGFVTFLYGIMALVYFFPTLYLYRFATRTRDAISEGHGELLEDGLENLASCFRFIGIMMIVVLILYGLGFGIAILVGVIGL